MNFKASAAKPAAPLCVKLLLGSAAIALLAFGTEGASAQTAAAAGGDQSAGNIEQVEVTATRVERAGYNAPTPTTVVGQDLLVTRAPATLADALVEIPQFKQSATPATQGAGVASTAGQSFVNLRGLGVNRSLTLVDGQRVVPNSANGTVDISTLPEALVKSVDVVTGGASADWGSDAVAGVVNFVLDTSYTGFKGNVEGALSARGDDGGGKASVTFGSNWGDGDRGHFLISGEYYHSDGVPLRSQRDFAGVFPGVITNPNYVAGAPCVGLNCYGRYVEPNVYQVTAFTGLITAGPLKGTTFDTTGNPIPYTYGTIAGTTQYYSTPQNLPDDFNPSLIVPQNRELIFSRFSYDVTSDINVFFDASYNLSATGPYSSSFAGSIGSETIYSDNAYLNPLVKTAMATNKITSFTFQEVREDWGSSQVRTDNATSRFVFGADGKIFGDWNFHAYLEHGYNHNDYSIANASKPANLALASDAVVNPATNQIVCRSTLTNPTNGCQPADLFGYGQATPQAIAYVMGTAQATRLYTQDAASAHITGNPFEIWDGPVSVAAGFDYRHEYADQTVDPVSAALGFAIGNPQPLKGAYSVEEGFFETVVPLLRDVPLFKTFDFSGAVRVTNYSTSGEATTWKVGLTDDVFDDLRLRGTRSHDIRAPNIIELFSSTQQTTGSVSDPLKGNSTYFIETLTAGNPALQPEISDTVSGGIVYQPSWFEGFSASVDYYDITIEDAITTTAAQTELNLCVAGSTIFCGQIVRDPTTGLITYISQAFLNLAQFKTSGEDLEASYNSDLQDLFPFAPFLGGNLGLRAIANHVAAYDTNSGVSILRQAGSLTIDQPGWSADFNATYTNGAFHGLLDVPYIGGGAYDKQYTGFQFYQNHVSPIYYVNATLEYTYSSNYVFYVAGSNLLDKAPPLIFNSSGGANYDRDGRAYRVGVRFTF